ncbi:MAG TPA: P63C domain-containing protein [Terriglobia bacterium]|nr:P63C domain-containing protein [Terriglobia bacterium]
MFDNEENQEIAAKGGKARAESLEPTERREIARHAAMARWNRELPKATHTGQLNIAGTVLNCAVLETGKRLLTQETFLTAIGRARKAKGKTGSFVVDGMPPFLAAENLKPFISEDLMQSTTPIFCRNENGIRLAGYDAMLLPMVCEVYLKLRDHYQSQGKEVPANQKHIVEACDLLIRGLARIGIIALVDEATGYQEQRAKDELSRILEAYIVEELRPWIRTFPDEFFKQVYRLHKWPYRPGTAKRPSYVGQLINKYIYGQLPPPVLPELKRLNPVTERGYRKHKHFQFLTADTGNVHLDRQITAVTTIMKVSDDRKDFEENFEKAFGKHYQGRLPLVVSKEGSIERRD